MSQTREKYKVHFIDFLSFRTWEKQENVISGCFSSVFRYLNKAYGFSYASSIPPFSFLWPIPPPMKFQEKFETLITSNKHLCNTCLCTFKSHFSQVQYYKVSKRSILKMPKNLYSGCGYDILKKVYTKSLLPYRAASPMKMVML